MKCQLIGLTFSESIVCICNRFKLILIINTVSLSRTKIQLYTDNNGCLGTALIFFGFQQLSYLESDHLFNFNFATMFRQYCSTLTFSSPKRYQTLVHNVAYHLSFTFKSPALQNYTSASSLSNSPKALILQFLVKCGKLHSVFKVLSKSHMFDTFLISRLCYKFSYKL